MIGEGTAQKIRDLGLSVVGVYSSVQHMQFSKPYTFIGAVQPTIFTQKCIQQGKLFHIPLYERIEHRDIVLSTPIDWVVFLSPSVVHLWFQYYFTSEKHSQVSYAVIGDTTKLVVEQYGQSVSVIPKQPNFRWLLEELEENI